MFEPADPRQPRQRGGKPEQRGEPDEGAEGAERVEGDEGAGRAEPRGRDQREPVTLIDLLQRLERSDDLRSLARDCGLSVRELRRRLRGWSQDLQQEVAARERSPGPAEGELFAFPGRPARDPAGPAAPGPGAPARGRGEGEGAGAVPQVRSAGPRPEPADGAEAGPEPGRAGPQWPELTAADGLCESPLPAEGERVLEAWTDGASRGNPGPAAIGIVFRQKDGPALASHAEAIGRATNNEAEYRAVIKALELCQRWRVERLDLYVDSELVARQLRGLYRVKSPSLRPLYQQAAHLARGLRQFRVRHVPRERNRHADHLASSALDGDRGSAG